MSLQVLDPKTKHVLEGFQDLIYAGRERVKELSDDELKTFLVAATRVTTANCGWQLYAVALKSLWLYEAAAAELVKRNSGIAPQRVVH